MKACIKTLFQANQHKLIHHPHDIISRVDFMPTHAEVGTAAVFVVVVVIGFSHHEKVNRQEVFRGVFLFEIGIAIDMGKPVDDHPVNRCHKDDDR